MKYQRVALTLLVSVAGLIFVTGAPRASALRSNGAVSGAENKLWDCEKRNVGFGLDKTGGAEQNVVRCFTHTFSVPPEGITSAVLKMDILAAGQSDTDEVVIATPKRNLPNGQSLECPNGGMAGCVTLRHGLQATSRSLTLNLLDIGCDPTIQKGDLTERQGAVRAALQTGVVHFFLQDDTAVLGTELIINEGPATGGCGESSTGGSTGGGGGTCTQATGASAPAPAFGSPEPAVTSCATMQVGQRRAKPGETVDIPVYVINGKDVGNINYEIDYDQNLVVIEAGQTRGPFMNKSTQQTNGGRNGRYLHGFAQTTAESTTADQPGMLLTRIRFTAKGKVGDKVPLHLDIPTMNTPDGTKIVMDKIDGLIEIVGPDGKTPGDCDDDAKLSEADALCALQVSVELLPKDFGIQKGLDLDGDGNVTSRDAAIILQRAEGRK